MRTSSAKAKGRRLQDWVANLIRDSFYLPPEDVKPAIMGETGRDIHLSARAFGLFPYSIECKNQEGLKGIYKHYDQATMHDPHAEPLLIIKSNHRRPLAIIDAEYFINNSGRSTNE